MQPGFRLHAVYLLPHSCFLCQKNCIFACVPCRCCYLRRTPNEQPDRKSQIVWPKQPESLWIRSSCGYLPQSCAPWLIHCACGLLHSCSTALPQMFRTFTRCSAWSNPWRPSTSVCCVWREWYGPNARARMCCTKLTKNDLSGPGKSLISWLQWCNVSKFSAAGARKNTPNAAQ